MIISFVPETDGLHFVWTIWHDARFQGWTTDEHAVIWGHEEPHPAISPSEPAPTGHRRRRTP